MTSQLRFGAVQDRGLFPENFVTTRLPERPEFAQVDAATLMARLTAVWEREGPGMANANESRTEEKLIEQVLDALGYHRLRHPGYQAAGRRQEPDYALYLSEQERLDAERLTGIDRYGTAVAVVESEVWEKPLTKVGGSEDPQGQIVRYVSLSKVGWGILTNGRLWRLYAYEGDLLSGAHLEIDLIELVENRAADGLRLFALLFGAASLRPDTSGATFLGRALEDANQYAVAVGSELEGHVFRALPLLAEGILGSAERTPHALADAFQDALVLLYRLLFCLHAEARDLLPLDREAYRSLSLTSQRREIAEAIDRGLELGGSTRNQAILWSLFRLIDRGDEQLGVNEYNGGLFAIGDHPRLDEASINDEQMGRAIDLLSRVHGEYVDYAELSVRHLGTIYERLLDYELVPGSNGRLELEPAAGRHDAGAYFTPNSVVSLVLERTVLPVLDRLRDQLESERVHGDDAVERFLRVRILDPAAGSGHFLVAAASLVARYIQGECEGHTSTFDELRRAVAERCLYGVDVNPMAVELARLSLWLTTVEKDRPLTFLGNLREGNSLVGASIEELLSGEDGLFADLLAEGASGLLERISTIMAGSSKTADDVHAKEALAEAAEALRAPLEQFADETISPKFPTEDPGRFFHWEIEFPEVFIGSDGAFLENGGFDAVVGNPPYVQIQSLGREMATYCRARYDAAIGSFDLYVPFFERGIELLAPHARLGYIAPNKYFKSEYGQQLRRILTEEHLVAEIIDFADFQIFAGATNYTAITVIDRNGGENLDYRKAGRGVAERMLGPEGTSSVVPEEYVHDALGSGTWRLVPRSERPLLDLLDAHNETLESSTEQIFQGLITSCDPVYIVQPLRRQGDRIAIFSKALDAETQLEPALLHPIATGKDVERYAFEPLRSLLLFPYRPGAGGMELIPFAELEERWPLTASYLSANEEALRGRERRAFDDDAWHRFGRNQGLAHQEKPKLGVAATVKNLEVALDAEGDVYFHNVRVNGILPSDSGPDLVELLVLLNSRLLDWIFRRGAAVHDNGYFAANKQFIARLPIIRPSGSEIAELGQHLNATASAISIERRDFLAWLDGELGVRAAELPGSTRLLRYDEFSLAEIHGVLREAGNRVPAAVSGRAFRELLAAEFEPSVEKLRELRRQLATAERDADHLVFELFEISDSHRALVNGEYA